MQKNGKASTRKAMKKMSEAEKRLKKARRRCLAITLGFAVLVVCAVLWQAFPPATWGEPTAAHERGTLAVRFLDVGQGDCALLTVDDTAVLVDAGTVERPSLVAELLESYGITRLDAVFVSHPHADHIGGLPSVLQRMSVGAVYMQIPEKTEEFGYYFDEALARMREKGVLHKMPHAGDRVSIGKMNFSVLGPFDLRAEDANDLSLCLRLDFGARSFLFCGDMTEGEEKTLFQLDGGLSADVLKVAHHGSHYSSSRDFLEAVHPSVAVISCGLYNDYGHPHADTLARLATVDAAVYRTDRHGTVLVTTDGDSLEVSCERTEKTKPAVTAAGATKSEGPSAEFEGAQADIAA